MTNSIWIGFDPREVDAYAVAKSSARRRMNVPIPIYGVVLDDLQRRGLYTRPLEYRASAADRPIMWDTISDAPMSTQHACARFLVKELAQTGWALFVDGDVLFRGNVYDLFRSLDPKYAVYCVKHEYTPKLGLKMDGQVQTAYAKKNWSSVMAINCDHPANNELTVDLINTLPGRELHRFCWLDESEIGALHPKWNHLVGESVEIANPAIAHFTLGIPSWAGFTDCQFADEWREELVRWAL